MQNSLPFLNVNDKRTATLSEKTESPPCRTLVKKSSVNSGVSHFQMFVIAFMEVFLSFDHCERSLMDHKKSRTRISITTSPAAGSPDRNLAAMRK